MATLKLYLFGSPRLELDDQPLTMRRRKALALLIYLAVTGQAHSRDALATLLFPELDQKRARAYLRRELADLKATLPDQWLESDREAIGLQATAPLWLDVAHFRVQVAACDSHAHPPSEVCAECLPLLESAVALYPADFLSGFSLPDSPAFDDWQFFEAEGLRQDLATSLERLIQGHGQQADYEAAIPPARRWVALDPLHEAAQQVLMQLYHHSGQSAAALRQYELYAKAVEQEFGLPPDEATTTLYEAIKAKRTLKLVLPLSGPPSPPEGGVALTSPPLGGIEGGPPLHQDISFTTTPDGVRIAYATVGSGPPLVKAASWLTHLEYEWQSPVWRHWLQELAQAHTLIRYDRRGCGLSDWEVDNFSLEAYVMELEAVVDTLGLTRFPLLGVSGGAPVAITYAYRHPEKVSHLILYGGYARGRMYRTNVPEEAEEGELLLKMMKLGWRKSNPAFRQVYTKLFIPDGTPEQISWFNELQRICSTPQLAARMSEAAYACNVTEQAKNLTVPTLILHAQADAVVSCEESYILAALIPQARFVSLESKNHILLEDEPAWPQFLNTVQQFLSSLNDK